MFRSIYLKISFFLVFVIILSLFIVSLAIFPDVKLLILFPSLEQKILKPVSFLYKLYFFIFILAILNFLLANFFFFKEKILSFFLCSASLLQSILTILYFLKIISFNF